MQHLAPVSSTQRLETLDVLRGFALLGILAMNIRAMAAPMSAYIHPYALFDYEGSSRLAYLFTTVVFDLKVMGLFSMLFGRAALREQAHGIRTAAARALVQADVRPVAIGLLHASSSGPATSSCYALCGILLLWWMRNRTARTLLIAAVGMLAIGAALAVVHWLAWGSMSEADRASNSAHDAHARTGAWRRRPDARRLHEVRGRKRASDVHVRNDVLPDVLPLAVRRDDADGNVAV